MQSMLSTAAAPPMMGRLLLILSFALCDVHGFFAGSTQFAAPAPQRLATPPFASRSAPHALRMGGAKDGPFAPLVKLTKRVMGEQRFLKFRANVISEHTKVIQAFVETLKLARTHRVRDWHCKKKNYPQDKEAQNTNV